MPRTLFICICLLMVAVTNMQAQDISRIPGLKTELANAAHDTDRVDALAMLCFSYSIVHTDTALLYGKQAMQLAKKINYPKGIADTYNNMGWVYYRMGDIDTAEIYLTTALEKFRAIGKRHLIRVPLGNLAILYADKLQYDKSLNCLREVLQYDEEAGDKKKLGIDYFQVGRLYNLLKDPKTARRYLEKAAENSKAAKDELHLAEAIMSIGNTYQSEGDQQRALQYYASCLPYLQNLNDLYRIGLTHENMAGSFGRLKRYDEAIRNYNIAIDNYRKLNSRLDIFTATMGLAEVYDLQNDTVHMDAALKQALEYATQLKDKKLQLQVMGMLAKFYYDQRNFEKAYIYSDSAALIKDSLFTLEKQAELLKLQTEFETERKEKENLLLKSQNLVAAEELRKNKILLTAAIAGLFMLMVVLYLLYRNRKVKIENIQALKQLNAQLESQKEEISRINTLLELKALRAQMNPHFIFNCMSSIQECMLTNRLDDANAYLSKLSRLLRMVLIHSDNENITLEKETEILILYLELESLRFKQGFSYTVDIDEEIPAEEILVPALILQPFVENAIWHGLLNKSGDRNLTVTVRQEDSNSLLCVIEDNGIGRRQAAALKTKFSQHASRGVSLIEKRIEILRAQTGQLQTGIEIIDLYGAGMEPLGTKVEINLPLITL